jgi:hypothetical protein
LRYDTPSWPMLVNHPVQQENDARGTTHGIIRYG